MTETIKVIGGKKLSGTVTPIGNKNAIVAAIPAAILTNETITYNNIPNTSDVTKLFSIIQQLGGTVEGKDQIKINCKNLRSWKIDEKLGGEIRASLNFVGPLLARFGKAEVPLPGGCDLGARSIEAHTNVFAKAGVKIERLQNSIRFTSPKVKPKSIRIWQLEASVTATENIAMYSAGINSQVEIIDAACEPHVTDLLNLLKDMGAKIEGIGSNRLAIKGRKDLKEAVFTPRPDFVDIAGFIVAAAITNGKIKIKGANIPDIVDGMIDWFSMFNIEIEKVGKDLVASQGKGGLIINVNRTGFPMAGNNLPKFVPRPWPGFPVDVLPVIAPLASKSQGRLLLQNWMFESGLEFVRELNFLGADIFIADPQRIIIHGSVNFKGGEVTPPHVIQAVKAIFLAALADPVGTIIHGAENLKRRYPNMIEIYQNLGATIERL